MPQDLEKQPLLAATPEHDSTPNEEPTLHELQQNVFKAQRAYMRAWSRTTSGAWHRRIIWFVTGLLMTFFLFCIVIIAQDSFDDYEPGYTGRVPLEAHIVRTTNTPV